MLDALPTTVCDWERIGAPLVGADALEMLDCQVHSNTTYRNRQTGAAVTCTILLAPAGPLSVHAPEICYASDNYRVETPRTHVEVPGGNGDDARSAKLWKVVLQQELADSKPVTVYYGWHPTRRTTESTHWLAPENERLYFAGAGMLYKLQLACFGRQAEDPGLDFLKEFLPAIKTNLLDEA